MYITWPFFVLLNLFSHQSWKRPQAEVIPIGTATIAVTSCSPQGHWINWDFVFFPSKTAVYLWFSVLNPQHTPSTVPYYIVFQSGKNDLILKCLMLWGIEPHRLYRKRQRFLVTLVQCHSLPPHNLAGEQINSLSTQLSKTYYCQTPNLKLHFNKTLLFSPHSCYTSDCESKSDLHIFLW